MKLSPFQAILMVVLGLSALIGLFVFATYTGSNSGSNTVGTVVVWGTLPKTGVQSALTTITQTDQSLKAVSYIEKDPSTIVTDLTAAIATGSGPDLILASQEELHALSKFLTPIPYGTLSTRTFTDAFVSEGQVFTAPSGMGYYGVPFLVDPLVLYSNRAILSSNGIARPPSTWESLTGLVPRIATLTPSRQITRGLIALGTYNNVANARGILSTLFLQTGTPLSRYSSGGTLAADLGQAGAGVPAGQAVLGFYTQFADPSKVSYTWNASLKDSEQMFLSGDLGLYLGYLSRASYLRAASPNLDFVVSPVPQPETATTKGVYGLLYAFMIPRGAANPNGAYQAAALLTNSAEQAVAATATGLAPATLSSLSAAPTDPVAAVGYAEALYAEGWLSPLPASTDAVFSGMIGNVISGRTTIDSALANAEQSLTALLQQ